MHGTGYNERALVSSLRFWNATHLGCIIESINITVFNAIIKKSYVLQEVFEEECELLEIDCHLRPCSGILRLTWLCSSIGSLKTLASISPYFIDMTKEKTKEKANKKVRGKEGKCRGSVDDGEVALSTPTT